MEMFAAGERDRYKRNIIFINNLLIFRPMPPFNRELSPHQQHPCLRSSQRLPWLERAAFEFPISFTRDDSFSQIAKRQNRLS